MISRGYFVIADITGYTEFLTKSGLEEAQGILDHLFEGLVEAIKPPLIVSNFQGDAVLAYAPEGSFTHGQTLFEMLGNIYNAFAGLVEHMEHNAGCGCNACDNLPKLDLKIIVHYGNYIMQNLRDRQEISGPDVILVHRMTKNKVRYHTGLSSYGLFSEAAINAMDLPDVRAGMQVVIEHYEHLGEVKLFVYDLRAKYEQARELRRVFVRPDQAVIHIECSLPVTPPLVWEYLTQPVYVKEWMAYESVTNAQVQMSKMERGSTFRCVRSAEQLEYTIVDWRPFDYLTIESTGLYDLPFRASYCLFHSAAGTLFKLYWQPVDDVPGQNMVSAFQEFYQTCIDKLSAMIATDLKTGKIQTSEHTSKPADHLRQTMQNL